MVNSNFLILLAAALAVSASADANATNLRSLAVERRLEAAEYMAVMAASSKPQCIVESGFDYTGEDLTAKSTATAEDCCDVCAKTDACRAFSWTSGTCYLKRGRSKVVINPAVRSALVIPGQRASGELKQDTDIVGYDNGSSKNMGKPEDCIGPCRRSLGCRAFTWSAENGGTCYWKTGRGESVYKAGVVSADVYPASNFEASQFNAREANVDYGVTDITSKKSASAEGCFKLCRETDICGAFTWTNYEGGTCYLKYGRTNVLKKTGAISGVIDAIPMGPVEYHSGHDITGNDLSNSRDAIPIACAYKCLNYVDGCKAATWTNYNGGTCWYKSVSGPIVTSTSANTYVFP